MSKPTQLRVLFLRTLQQLRSRVLFAVLILAVLTPVLTVIYSITRPSPSVVYAAPPTTLNFQARLMTSGGSLVPDGVYNVEFKLFNAVTSSGSSQGSCTGDANCLWTETRLTGDPANQQVVVKNGYFSVYLGDKTALPSDIWDQQLWLSMNIGGTSGPVWDGEMSPRIRLTSVPFAYRATSAVTADGLFYDNGSFTGEVDFATMTANRRFLFPDTSLATTASPGTICVYNGAASNCPAASGSAYYIQNDTVLQTGSNFNIQGRNDSGSGTDGTVVGRFQGAAGGQTVDLVQFAASNGTVLAAVTASGNLQVANSIDTRTAGTLSIGTATATAISIGDTGVTTTIEGAITVDEAATFNGSVTVAAEQTLRLVGGTTAQRPGVPQEGMMYFDTDTDQLLVYANGKWQADRNGNTKVVAASTASQAIKDAADYVVDGTADEVEINQALAAGAGGTVYLTGGTFTVSGTILIPDNTVFAGAGQSTVIAMDVSGSDNLIQDAGTPGEGIIIRDMRLDGTNAVSGTHHAIYFDGLNSAALAFTGNEIERVTTENWTGDGLYITGDSILNGVNKSALSSISVNNNSVVVTLSNSIISGNIAIDGSGINTVSNNIVYGTVSVTSSGNVIDLLGNSIAGELVVNSSGVRRVSNNTISGIDITNSAIATAITNNIVSRTNVDAISITSSDNVQIISNTLYDDSGSGHGIHITDALSDNTYISGNILNGLTINDLGTGTIYGGQEDNLTNYIVQPAGDILLNANTDVDGDLTVTGTTTTDSLDVTNDAGIGGDLTVTGTITVSTLGATDTDAVVCINSSGELAACNSTFASGNFILNQSASQQTADYWISGSARADTSVLTPTVDTATATTLAIGTTTANALSVSRTGVTTTINGSLTVSEVTQLNGNLIVAQSGNVAFQRNTTNYTATGMQDSVDFGTGALFRITSASAVTINGIAGGADGRIMTIMNASASDVTLGNSASGTAAHNVVTGTGSAVIIPSGSSVQLAYDSGTSVWRIVGGTAVAGGAANQQLSNLSGTVAVNQALIPGASFDNTLDLGSSSYGWRTLYADTSVLTPTVDTATATTLAIGTTTANALSVSRTGVTTTINGALTVSEATQLNNNLTVAQTGNVAFQRNTTNYTATGTQNDINFGTGALFRITSATALTITSIAGGTDGRLITLVNASANAVTINNDSGGTAANRIITGTGANITIPAGASLNLAYDSGSSRWRVIGSTAAANGYIQLQSTTPGAAQTGNFNINGTGVIGTAIQVPLIDTASAVALNIGTTNATQINLNKNTQITGNLTFTEGANRTLSVAARGTAGVGYNLTIAAGAANGSGNAGGALLLQGGAAVAGNANGGSVTLSGGAGSGTGVLGLVNLSPTAFTPTGSTQNFSVSGSLTAGLVDTYSTIPVNATNPGLDITIPVPHAGNQVVGRIIYITAVDNTNDFTLVLGGTNIEIAMKENSTATLIWNGLGWTAAGASSSTDLQSAYNNTLTSAGGAEIVLNPTGGAADGFTIRNNPTTPISGGLLEVQSSIGTNLFSVNNRGIELANNGGAENAFASDWTAAPVSATIAQTSTAGEFVTGRYGVRVTTTNSLNSGVRNNLTSNPAVSTFYTVSFTAKSSVLSTPINVQYSYNGGTNLVACTDYSTQTITSSNWTKITCTIPTPANAVTNPDLIIGKTDTSTPIIYIDNLSFQRNDTTTQPSNVQIGGGNDGGPVTLFTLDRASAPPVAAGDETYYGSMYYDTVTGSIQCYEADGWGACGSPPDNIVTLTPEYTGAVLNGNGIGVMTADFCTNETRTTTIQINTSLCTTLGEARNYYRWTSPQATLQEYSIYVNYKLPSTFKEFANNSTMRLTAYRDDVDATDAAVEMTTYRKNVSGAEITQCGSTTPITTTGVLNTWETTSVTGNENTCGFVGGDYIVFKITMKSRNNTNVYVENLDFTFNNR